MNTQKTPNTELFKSLAPIFDEYIKNRDADDKKWKEMTEDARYGVLLMKGLPPLDADKYSKRELCLIPSPVFEKLFNL